MHALDPVDAGNTDEFGDIDDVPYEDVKLPETPNIKREPKAPSQA